MTYARSHAVYHLWWRAEEIKDSREAMSVLSEAILQKAWAPGGSDYTLFGREWGSIEVFEEKSNMTEVKALRKLVWQW